MNRTDGKRPPLSPQEGWLSDGRQVLHFRPISSSRWSQWLEVTLGELMPSGDPPLLKRRKELSWVGRPAHRSGIRLPRPKPEAMQKHR